MTSPPEEAGCVDFRTPRDRRNERSFNAWLLGAMLLYLGATASIRWRQAMPVAVPWLLVGLTVVAFALATRSYLRFLRQADELLRKLHTEGMAIGFGAALLVALLYPLFEGLGAPRLGLHLLAVSTMLAAGAGGWLRARRHARGDAA